MFSSLHQIWITLYYQANLHGTTVVQLLPEYNRLHSMLWGLSVLCVGGGREIQLNCGVHCIGLSLDIKLIFILCGSFLPSKRE